MCEGHTDSQPLNAVLAHPKPAKGFEEGGRQSRVCERQENPSYHVGKSIIQQ